MDMQKKILKNLQSFNTLVFKPHINLTHSSSPKEKILQNQINIIAKNITNFLTKLPAGGDRLALVAASIK